MKSNKKQKKCCRLHVLSWIMIGLVLITAMRSAAAVSASEMPDDTVVAKINGLPVQMREFMLMVNKNRSEVFSYFKQTYNAEDSETFWTDQFEGESPSELVKQYAIDELKETKTEQALAIEYGIIENADYDKFFAEWKAENERRKTAKANNEVIFGPVEYRELDYFNYVHSNMEVELKKKLRETEFDFSESDYLSYYENNQKLFETEDGKSIPIEEVKEAIKSNLTDQYYDQFIAQEIENATVEIVEGVYDLIKVG